MLALKRFLIFFVFSFLIIMTFKFTYISSRADLQEALINAIASQDLSGQRDILKSVKTNEELNNLLTSFFEDNKSAASLKYLVSLDSVKLLNKYFDTLRIEEIDKDFLEPIFKSALASGALKIATKLMEKDLVVLNDEILITNFDSIARVEDEEKIKEFVAAIKRAGFLKTLIEDRNIYGEDKTLKALIHYIAQHCNMVWLKNFIANGGSVRIMDINKDTPFNTAVTTLFPGTLDKKIEFVKYMIEKGKIRSLYTNREDKTACDYAREYLEKYQKLYKKQTSLVIKNSIQNKMNVYSTLIGILCKLYRN